MTDITSSDKEGELHDRWRI